MNKIRDFARISGKYYPPLFSNSAIKISQSPPPPPPPPPSSIKVERYVVVYLLLFRRKGSISVLTNIFWMILVSSSVESAVLARIFLSKS